MESWYKSSVEGRELALISRKFGFMELSSSCCAEIGDPLDLRQGLRESLEFPKGSQATCRV